MRYKIFLCIAVFLCGTPTINAQEISPIIVETVRDSISPTTTRTGEPVIQVYKITYISSKNWDKEVIILEEDMMPKSFPLPAGDFEITDWKMDKPKVDPGEETSEITRFVHVTLRIINSKKGAYKIPKFQILWALKVGDKIENQTPMETEEVLVNYVTTVTPEPFVDIREAVNFDDYSSQARLFWWISRVGMPLVVFTPLLLWTRSFRKSRKNKKEEISRQLDQESPEYVASSPEMTFNRAYRNFLNTVDNINLGELIPAIEKKLAESLNDLIRAKLDELNPGDTSGEMAKYIQKNFKEGVEKNALIFLQERLVAYHSDIEAQTELALTEENLPDELSQLRKNARLLKRWWRILGRFE